MVFTITRLLMIVYCVTRITVSAAAYPDVYFVEKECFMGSVTYEVGGIHSSSLVLRAVEYPPYSPFMNCTITLIPLFSHYTSQQGIILSVLKLDFKSSSILDCTDYIQVYSAYGPISKKLCGFRIDALGLESYNTIGKMYLKYSTGMRTDAHVFQEGFKVVVTTFTKPPCRSDEFRCQNDKCIWKALTCDGFNNCGDRSDENYGTCRKYVRQTDYTDFYVILIACCAGSILVAVVFGAYVWIKKWRRRRSSSEGSFDNPLTMHPPVDRPPPYTVSADPLVPSTSAFKEDPPPYEP